MSRIREVTLKELRLDLTKLTQDLDDRTTLVVTRNKTPIAVIQYVAPERRGHYRKLLDAADTSEALTSAPARKTRPPAKKS